MTRRAPTRNDSPWSNVRYVVYCHICGWGWDEQDPGVRFIQTDHVWECYDEAACFDRLTAYRLQLLELQAAENREGA